MRRALEEAFRDLRARMLNLFILLVFYKCLLECLGEVLRFSKLFCDCVEGKVVTGASIPPVCNKRALNCDTFLCLVYIASSLFQFEVITFLESKLLPLSSNLST